MYKVVKRDGSVADFEMTRIKDAIQKAFAACNRNDHPSVTDFLALKAVSHFEPKIKNDLIAVEDIQDSVEDVLGQAGYSDVAKAYILYRKQHEKLRNIKGTVLDYKELVNSYVNVTDWRVKENSTVTYSVGGLILSNSGAITANYWLSEIYDNEIANAHRNADIHLHDLSMLTGYCFTGDTCIKTLDGKNPSFEELVESGTKELWVFAFDTDKNCVTIAKAINPRVTRTTNELVEIALTSGEIIRCTPDHLFMLRDGSYIKAKELKANTSLMPLYIGEKSRYVSINDVWHKENKKYLHRWIAELILQRNLYKTEVVHHIDGDKHNNTPENLEVISDKEHRSQELKKTMQSELWKKSNHERLVKYNKSSLKRETVSKFASNRERNEQGRFAAFSYQPQKDPQGIYYNHCVRSVKTIELDEPLKMYDLTVPGYENFALDAGVFVHNCAGWSLKQLIQEGLGGIPGKITSAPASHLSTLCNQMVNFLGILQNEWAGAQAFSSFDTYLAPFVKADNLSYKEVKQCIQSFVYGVNTPSRWGCVNSDTEVLSVNGFKKYNELKEGDLIYTWNNGELQINPVRKVIIKPYKGKLHSYIGRGYNQTVTPNHRVLVKMHNSDQCAIKLSQDILNTKTPYALPVKFSSSELKGAKLSDDEIKLAAMVYTDGNKKILELFGSKEEIDPVLFEMNQKQALLFLKTWAHFYGDEEKMLLQYDNPKIADQLQQIAVLAGYTSYFKTRKNSKTQYIKLRKSSTVYPVDRREVDYDGFVWCPNVENGTAVFRYKGNIFISGQTQAPFSNITLDWTVPADLAEMNCIVGGKEVDFKYKDCKAEMDMINKAFIEIMIEGDANGRGFQYPIPTYSITKDFDWSETENNKLLFEMTSKYGTPYFSNYVNSDMEPSDVRSMAVLGTQNVIYQDKYGRVSKNEIRHLVNNWVDKGVRGYKMLMNGKFIDVIDMFRVPYEKYSKIVALQTELGTTQRFSYDHKCPIIRNGQYLEVLSQDVCAGDKLLLAKHPYSESNVGSYEAGKILGYYIAVGWHTHTNEIMFAVNERRNDIMKEIREFFSAYGCQINVEAPLNHACKVHVYGKAATGFVDMYVKGDKALNKRLLVSIYNTSSDFRTGLYDGYYTTDGCPKAHSFAHTTNKSLCFDFIDAFSTIGKYFRYSENHNNARYFKPDKSDKETFASYKLQVAKLEEYNEDYFLCEVQNVALEDASRINSVYNFTVSTKEHLYQLPNGIITHQCCRLRLDLRELRKKSGGFFGSGESTGSVGVVTVNLPRIAYLAEDEQDFYRRLDRILDISARSLKVKRQTISKLLDEGLYPYTKRYLGTFDNHFSTIGIVGMNEAGLNANWLRADMAHPKTQAFAEDVLNHIRTRLSDYQEMYGDLYNLEATPAESTSYRLAKHDAERFPNIITASKETPYYTNSTHLPVGYTEDMFAALDIQDNLQTLYNSGTVFHAFLGEKLPDWRSAMDLVRKIANNYRLPYYTISPIYSVCKNHGYITGEKYECPECGEKTEVYSRITGYYRPVGNWNVGKTQEFKDRKLYVPKDDRALDGECEKCRVPESTESQDSLNSGLADGIYIFATETCPNCKIAEAKLAKASIRYTKLLANENVQLAKKLGIKQAPTLLVVKGENVSKYVGISQIVKFIEDIR